MEKFLTILTFKIKEFFPYLSWVFDVRDIKLAVKYIVITGHNFLFGISRKYIDSIFIYCNFFSEGLKVLKP